MTAHQMIARVRNLPPISKAALELVNNLGRSEIGNDDIVHVLKQDGVLTAKLLRACNSSAMGLREPVASVDHAVLILGHQQLFQMVMALAAHGPLAMPLGAYAMESDDLWRHSLLAATAAEAAVAEGLDLGVDSASAFTIGLLHDIGKLVTNQFLTRQSMLAMRQQIVEGRSAVQAEKDILGADHAEVGAGLLYVWRLPMHIVEAVALHHQPVLHPQPRISALGAFANRAAHLAAALTLEQEPNAVKGDNQLFEALDFGPERLPALLERVREVSVGTNELMVAA